MCNKELLNSCKRGNKIAPFQHNCRVKWYLSAKEVQFYSPSSTYAANVLLVLYFIAFIYRAIFDMLSKVRHTCWLLKWCVKNCSIVKLQNNNKLFKFGALAINQIAHLLKLLESIVHWWDWHDEFGEIFWTSYSTHHRRGWLLSWMDGGGVMKIPRKHPFFNRRVGPTIIFKKWVFSELYV